jgi:hypothetical protein
VRQATLLLFLICSAAEASVVTLNPYTFSSTCDGIPGATNSGCSDGNTSVTFGLNGATGPYVTASASGSDSGVSTLGDLVYQIFVAGPGTTAQVDVRYLLNVSGQFTQPLGNDEAALLNTGAALTVGPNNLADTEIHVNASGGSSENGFPPSLSDTSVNAGYANGAWAGLLDGPQTITLATGIAYNVTLRVQANCTGQGTGNSVINCGTSASIDPTFTIDPGQSNAAQYSILFSPGVGNGSAVPEPATFFLLALGGLALIFLRR